MRGFHGGFHGDPLIRTPIRHAS